MDRKNRIIRAFTLVEILTTIAILGILLAVLIPALNQAGKSALIVKQRAQFHTIEIALETFRSDTGDYPPSAWNTGMYGEYSASQRLAEAIIGRDGFGYHPRSRFHRNGLSATGQSLYYPWIEADGLTEEEKAANLASRKGPYLELESANAVPLLNYGTYTELVSEAQPSYVLADVFKTARLAGGRKTGMPILYYRANRFRAGHSGATMGTNTYEIADSNNGITSGTYDTIDPDWFYRRTQNPNFTAPRRPYRAESFILHSAGPDGRYGTADDVFNFDEGN